MTFSATENTSWRETLLAPRETDFCFQLDLVSLTLWAAYQCDQTLCICLIWMQETVWGGYQPQQWHYATILTPQVTQNPKIWAKQCGYQFEFEAATICPWTAYQCAQTLCICLMWIQEAVWGGCQPQPWLMTYFWLHLHKWPRTPKSEPSSVSITI